MRYINLHFTCFTYLLTWTPGRLYSGPSIDMYWLVPVTTAIITTTCIFCIYV